MNLSELLQVMSTDINSLSLSEKMMGCAVVTVLAMLIVFAVLIIIAFMVSILRKLVEEKKPEPIKVTASSEPTPVIEEEATDDGELVAAISAAIASSIGTSPSKIVVTRIERVLDNGTSWSRAAINDQMR